MAAALPPERVRALWGSLEAAAGSFARIQAIDVVRADALRAATVTCAFQRLRRIVRVVFDADDRVTGLFVSPVPADIEARTQDRRAQPSRPIRRSTTCSSPEAAP